jgi:hypothetical protein
VKVMQYRVVLIREPGSEARRYYVGPDGERLLVESWRPMVRLDQALDVLRRLTASRECCVELDRQQRSSGKAMQVCTIGRTRIASRCLAPAIAVCAWQWWRCRERRAERAVAPQQEGLPYG